jgi:hypothetical protein
MPKKKKPVAPAVRKRTSHPSVTFGEAVYTSLDGLTRSEKYALLHGFVTVTLRRLRDAAVVDAKHYEAALFALGEPTEAP